MDSIASSVRLDVLKNGVIIRIIPRLDESLNEEWITNKARFVYDSFYASRINYPKILVFNSYVNLS